jgi:hypothetical protein
VVIATDDAFFFVATSFSRKYISAMEIRNYPTSVIPATERQVSAGNAYREGMLESKI